MERTQNVEREGRLLDAAARLIVRYGYDKTTVSDIAAEAGVSKGAVYLHWPSKDRLFEALLLREMKDFAVAWMEQIEQDPDGGKLHAMYLHSMTVLASMPLLRALVTQDRRVIGDFLRHQDRAVMRQRNMFSKEFVALLQQVGVVRVDMEPEMVAYLLSCLRAGMVFIEELIDRDQIPPLEASIPALAEMIERSFAPPGGGDSEAGKRILRQMVAILQERWAQGKLV